MWSHKPRYSNLGREDTGHACWHNAFASRYVRCSVFSDIRRFSWRTAREQDGHEHAGTCPGLCRDSWSGLPWPELDGAPWVLHRIIFPGLARLARPEARFVRAFPLKAPANRAGKLSKVEDSREESLGSVSRLIGWRGGILVLPGRGPTSALINFSRPLFPFRLVTYPVLASNGLVRSMDEWPAELHVPCHQCLTLHPENEPRRFPCGRNMATRHAVTLSRCVSRSGSLEVARPSAQCPASCQPPQYRSLTELGPESSSWGSRP